METVLGYLRDHPFFRDVGHPQLEEIARLAVSRTLARGEIVALEGDPCSMVYLVVEGRIHALKMSLEGREQVVSELGPGQAFYIVPALDGGPLPATARAATRATLVGLPCRGFLSLLHQHPVIAMRVLKALAQRLRQLTSLVEDLALHTVPQRLARLLLDRARSPVASRITQREMATQLGTVREVVSRTLSQFERQGWINLRRGVIEVVDGDALRRAALV